MRQVGHRTGGVFTCAGMEPRERGAGYPSSWPVILVRPRFLRSALRHCRAKNLQGDAMAVVNFNRSIPELLTDVVNNFTVLVRKETQLARVEMSEKIGELALGIGLLIGGSVLLIPALVILLQSAVAGLEAAGIGSAWSALIVGGVTLLIGLLLLVLGVGRLKAARPVPTKTIEQLQRDAEVAKTQVRNEDDTSKRAA